MLPLQDLNPTRRTPVFTWGLIAVNALVFFWQMSLSQSELNRVFATLAVVPADFSAAPFSLESWLDVLRSMFLHGGYDHILGNMLYLYLFGDNVEDRFGRPLFLALYFVSGAIASVAQVIIDPASPVPMVGASGAIAGVLGSYLVLFPNVKVRGIVLLGSLGRMSELPAIAVLGMWFALQVVDGFGSLAVASQYGGGVAFFAHIGGFIGGLVLTLIFVTMFPQPPVEERRNMLYERSKKYRY
jgi:membrane associated rhomboid family serine protease